MPGDPTTCREHARRCAELAALVATPEEREHFLALERTWIRFAAELESAERFSTQQMRLIARSLTRLRPAR
jgi:hypothetical protein